MIWIRINSLLAFFAAVMFGGSLFEVILRADAWIRIPAWVELGALLVVIGGSIAAWYYVRTWLDALDWWLVRSVTKQDRQDQSSAYLFAFRLGHAIGKAGRKNDAKPAS